MTATLTREAAPPVTAPASKRSPRPRHFLRSASFYVVASIVALLFASPLLWLFISSFKGTAEFAQVPPTYLPERPSLENYQLLADAGMWGYVLNSVGASLGTVLLGTLLSVLAGFGFARFRFRGAGVQFIVLLSTLMIPFQSIIPALYAILDQLSLTNSIFGLVLVYTSFILPFGVFTMRAAFSAIPDGIEEAAIMDGASTWTTLVRVMAPMVVPGIATVAIYAFFNAWNEFLAALIFTTRQDAFTLPVALANLQSGAFGTLNWGVLEAGAIVSAVPCIIVFLILQRYYVAGLTAGAVKG
ncbi:carbohydrate ABC transporter permease [Microbacterium sp. ET2]|uniref:carbohydrate ABC transporter permease n=1 Tax=Microbacterium albipurpureum TaxID=3050384 RepID=UPI00259CF5D0|nr:carbohydrate ABC transporter permease [Microbacterium sp. ET2 (Ac-2212)]WJL97050.1 carbohydrate ABC transporter permease [Microbacterium sp. ET2 (Ac-2212)]